MPAPEPSEHTSLTKNHCAITGRNANFANASDRAVGSRVLVVLGLFPLEAGVCYNPQPAQEYYVNG